MREMVLTPFGLVVMCPSCGSTRKRTRHCQHLCVRSFGGYLSMQTYGMPPQQPHLHVRCTECEFEWLSEVRHPGEVQSL